MLVADFSLFDQISLIADKHDLDVGTAVLLEVFQPFFDVAEGLFVGDIVDQESGSRRAVIASGDGLEGLLAGRIPDLQLDAGVGGLDDFGPELNADGDFMLLPEGAIDELEEKAALPDAGVADDDVFKQVVVTHLLMFCSS